MKKYKLILFLSTALLSVACTDSFFDLEPSSSVPTDKVYKTAEDFNVAVIGCYSKLQTQVSYFTECCEYRSDNLTLSAPTAGTQDRYDIDQFADKASNGILEDAWANFNNGVYRCNLVLDRIDEANFDATLKKQYKGEALFIRALTYFRFLSVRLNRLKNKLLANYLRNRGNDLATVRNSAFCVAILSNNSFICKYNIFFRKYELSVAIL